MPLADLTVLDLSIARSGPAAARQFADWGANVIRIEPSERVDALAPDDSDYLNLHRGKRAMTLNLKSDAGLEVFFRLVERADVLIENFRPPVKVALSIDYPTVAARNPRLVYGSISGYGQSGPYSAKGALDQIIQGIGGLMSVTGHPGSGPLRAGIAVADLAAGHHLAFGILAALHERERSGLGQWVQVSLLESLITMLDFQAARWTIDGELPGQVGNDHPNRMPIGMYPASDGDINLAAYSDRLWERLCDALEEPSLAHDERFASAGLRVTNRGALNAQISAITRTRPRSEWLARLDAHGIPAGPIYSIQEMFADPQVASLGMTISLDHPQRGPVEVIRSAVTMNRTPSHVSRAAPLPGQHQAEILTELGIGPGEARDLEARGAF